MKPMSIIIAFIACLVGVFICAYIYIKKRRHEKLACPREHPCDIVLHSRFGRTFGIPNEALGIAYFFLVSFLLYLLISSTVYTVGLFYILFFLIVLGGLFSLYMVGLQAFIIKSWCAWCLGIALMNFVLIGSLYQLPFEIISPLLASQKVWWVIVHNIGFILGLGAVTLTDLFFFRFLKDNIISSEEKETMDTLANIIWVGLLVLVVSGIALYLPGQEYLAVSAKFLLKLTVIGVIITNGILLNMMVAPHMRRLSFEGNIPARRFRRVAFALGGISFTSWYVAFLLGSLRKINFDFSTALIGYVVFLVCVIVGSQIAERYMTKKHNLSQVDGEQS